MTINKVQVRVFENEHEQVKKALLGLFPFDAVQEKIKVFVQQAEGFDHKHIKIYRVVLDKQRHIKQFITNLLNNLTDFQKEQLQKYTVDEEQQLYIRLDKKSWEQGNLKLTTTGNCYHITLSITTYPKNIIKAQKEATNTFK